MKLSLNTQILIGAAAGLLFGFFLTKFPQSAPWRIHSLYIASLIGSIFVNLLKMIIIPLIFLSLTVGIANLRAHAQMDRVWKITMIYFLATPTLAVILGLTLMNIFKPGYGLALAMFQDSMTNFSAQNLTLAEFVNEFFAGLFMNPLEALSKGMIIPSVVFAIFLGIALVALGEKAKTTVNLFNELLELVMLIVGWIMRVLPIGIAALLVKLVITQDPRLFSALGEYMILVIGGTLFHGFVILPFILFIFTGMNPFTFLGRIREALITAFSTSSSSATLPITYRCVVDNLKVNKHVAGFILPLGATANMDGTALYEAMAALFVANLAGIHLNIVQQIVVALMAIIASIGAPGIPSAGMVTLAMVFQSVGLPIEAIAILIPIDRPLDAIRTVVNVEGDAICSVIVHEHTSP